ncbi:hypothetical protein CYJ36_06400 [Bacillus sp. UMB0893]|nr:hypothetical protein CYJ36_06400 [Bacillus sp. UMB0893]
MEGIHVCTILTIIHRTNDMNSMIKVIRLIKKNMVTLLNISQFKLIPSIAITKGNKIATQYLKKISMKSLCFKINGMPSLGE